MWTLVGDQQGGLAKICGQGWANSINGYQLRVRTTVKSMNPWWLLCFEILPGDKQSFGGVDHTPWTKMFLCSLGKLKNLFAKHSSYASSLCGHDLQDWFSPAERPPDPLRDVVSRNPRSKKGGITEVEKSRWILEGCMAEWFAWQARSYSRVFEHLIQRTFSDLDRSLWVNGS